MSEKAHPDTSLVFAIIAVLWVFAYYSLRINEITNVIAVELFAVAGVFLMIMLTFIALRRDKIEEWEKEQLKDVK